MNKLLFIFFSIISFISSSYALENEFDYEKYSVQETNALENALSFLNNSEIDKNSFSTSEINNFLNTNNINTSYISFLSIEKINIISSKSFAEVIIKPIIPITEDFIQQVVFAPLSKYKIRQVGNNSYLVYLPFSSNNTDDIKVSTNDTNITTIEQEVVSENGLDSLLDMVEGSCAYGYTKLNNNKYCSETFVKNTFLEDIIKDKSCPQFMYFNSIQGICTPSISYIEINLSNGNYCPEGFIYEENTKKCFNGVTGAQEEDLIKLFDNPSCELPGYTFNTSSEMCEFQEIEDFYFPTPTKLKQTYPALYKLKDGDLWENPEDVIKKPEEQLYNLCKDNYVLEGFNCVQSEFSCNSGDLIDSLYCLTPKDQYKCDNNEILNGTKCDKFLYTKTCLENDTRLNEDECEKTLKVPFCNNDMSDFKETLPAVQKKDIYIKPIIYNSDYFDNTIGMISYSGLEGGVNSLKGYYGDIPLGLNYDVLIGQFSNGFKLASTENKNVYGLNIQFQSLTIGESCEAAGFDCPPEHPYYFKWNSFTQDKSICPEGFVWDFNTQNCLSEIICPKYFKKVGRDCVPDYPLPNNFIEINIDGTTWWKQDNELIYTCPEGTIENGINCTKETIVDLLVKQELICPKDFILENPDGTCLMSQSFSTNFENENCLDGSDYIFDTVSNICIKDNNLEKILTDVYYCPTNYINNGTSCVLTEILDKIETIKTFDLIKPFFPEEELICPDTYIELSTGECVKKVFIDKIDKNVFVETGITSNTWTEELDLINGNLIIDILWEGSTITSFTVENYDYINNTTSIPETHLFDTWLYKKICTPEDLNNISCEDGWTKINNNLCEKTLYMDKEISLQDLSGSNTSISTYCLEGWTDNGVNCEQTIQSQPILLTCHLERSRIETIQVCPESIEFNWIEDTEDTSKCYRNTYLPKQSPIGYSCPNGMTFNEFKNTCESTTISEEPILKKWDVNNPILENNQYLRCAEEIEYMEKPTRGTTITKLFTPTQPNSNYINNLTVLLQSKSDYLFDLSLSTEPEYKYNKFLSLEEWNNVNLTISNNDLLNSIIVWSNGEVGKLYRIGLDNLTPRLYHNSCQGLVYTCSDGMKLEDEKCVPEDKTYAKPICNNNNLFFSENGTCISKDLLTCPKGYDFNNGMCESNFKKEEGYLDGGVCKVAKEISTCPENTSVSGELCSNTMSAIDWYNFYNNSKNKQDYVNEFISQDLNFKIGFALYANEIPLNIQEQLISNTNIEVLSALYYNKNNLVLSDKSINTLENQLSELDSTISMSMPYNTYTIDFQPKISEIIGSFLPDIREEKYIYEPPLISTVTKTNASTYTIFETENAIKKIIDSYSIKNLNSTTIQVNENEKPIHTCPINYKIVEIIPDEKIVEINKQIVNGIEQNIETITWIPGEYTCELDVEYKCIDLADNLNEDNKICTKEIINYTCKDGFNLKNNTCISGSLLFSNSFMCAENWFPNNSLCFKKEDLICKDGWSLFVKDGIEKCKQVVETCENGWNIEGNECKKTYKSCTMDTNGGIVCPVGFYNENGSCTRKTYSGLVNGSCDTKNGFVDNPNGLIDSLKCIKTEISCSGLENGGCGNGTLMEEIIDPNKICVSSYIDILLPKIVDEFIPATITPPIINEQTASPAKYELIEDRCNTKNGNFSFSYNSNNPKNLECEFRDILFDPTVDHYSCLENEGLLYGPDLNLCKIVRESEVTCKPGYSFVPEIHQCVMDNLSIDAPKIELTKDLNCGGDLYTPNGDIWELRPQLFTGIGVKPTINIVINHQYNNTQFINGGSIFDYVGAYIDKNTGKAITFITYNNCINKPLYIFPQELIQVSEPICPIVQGSRGKMVQLEYNRDKLKCDYVDIVPAIHQKVCRNIEEIKEIPYNIPISLEKSWITNNEMYKAYENIKKVDETKCSYEIVYYDKPKVCTKLDICQDKVGLQTNCLPKTAKPLNNSFVIINPNDNSTCLHQWKNCGKDLVLPEGAITEEWIFKDENTCSIEYIKTPEYEYCSENNHTYFSSETISEVKEVEIGSTSNKPIEISYNNNIFPYYKPEIVKIYNTTIINNLWNIEGQLIDNIKSTKTEYTKNRKLVSEPLDTLYNEHYYGGWTPLNKCDTHRSSYTCPEGYTLIGNGCNTNNENGFVPRVEDMLLGGNSTTTICRCTKKIIQDSKPLECPEGYTLQENLSVCVLINI